MSVSSNKKSIKRKFSDAHALCVKLTALSA